jgi:hypothetical protein
MTSTRKMPSDADFEETILDLLCQREAEKTICPSEAARALAGKDPDAWSRLMPLIRRTAVRMMKEGRIEIRRKGKAVDPDDFRGIYRIGRGGAVS